MIVVIFESRPKPGKTQAYLDMDAALMPLVQDIDGSISVGRFESVSEEEAKRSLQLMVSPGQASTRFDLIVQRARHTRPC